MAVGLGTNIVAMVNLKGDDQETGIGAQKEEKGEAKDTRGC